MCWYFIVVLMCIFQMTGDTECPLLIFKVRFWSPCWFVAVPDIFWTSCLSDIWQIPSTSWPAFRPFIYTAKLKFFILMNTRKGKTVHVAVRKRPNLWVHTVTDLRRGKQLTEWDPAFAWVLDYKYNVTLLNPLKLQIQWTTDLTTSSVPTIYQEYLCITS